MNVKLGDAGETISVSADTTLYAKWSADSYTITASATGGKVLETTGWTLATGSTSATKKVVYGGTYGTLPSATRLGYIHQGWFTSDDGGTKIEPSTPVTITNNQTIYAQWTPITYTIAFTLNNGQTTNSISATFDEITTIQSPTYTGYIFQGWTSTTINTDTALYIVDSTETKWNGSAYGTGLNSVTFKNLTATDKATVTLVANWKENPNIPYTVKHYVMNTSGAYIQKATDNLQGTTNTTLTLSSLMNESLLVANGIAYKEARVGGNVATTASILADGSLVIELYYERIKHTLTLEKGTKGIVQMVGADEYYYDQIVTITATKLKEDYLWQKWELNIANISEKDKEKQTLTFTMPTHDVNVIGYARMVAPEDIFVQAHDDETATIIQYHGSATDLVIPEENWEQKEKISVCIMWIHL